MKGGGIDPPVLPGKAGRKLLRAGVHILASRGNPVGGENKRGN